jgi:TPR repeat protein
MEQAASNPGSANSAYSSSIYSPQSAEYMHNMNDWNVSKPHPSQQQGYNQNMPPPNNYQQAPPLSQQANHFPPRTTSHAPVAEQPNFSPFPVLRNPPPNVPPTDEQKEATLESARAAVLSCNDPDTQLTWAQDALAYVEVCQQNEERIALAQTPRSRTPRIEHVLKEDALKIVNFLAEQHHPRAEFMRGMWLEFGKFGHRVDKKEAFYCYSRAAEKGYLRAEYRIGMQFESSNDALKAIKYYQKGADAGDSAACYRLGMMTLLGQHGQMQDYERGLNLIYMAAQTADENAPQGAYVFGMLQAQQMPQVQIPDHYLPKDLAGAKVNIEKAAYLGFAKAQIKMGSAYELAELGCPFDPALSIHYNVLAARQGEPEAELAISKWMLCGHEGLFEKNEEVAFTYAQRAALSGFPTAQFAMGYYYEVGIYVPVNFEQAKEWYRKASQSGNSDASGRIEAISRSKTLSRKDHESVALKKIRQQRGSMIADVSVPPVPTMPTLSEESESLQMPDPSRLSLNDQRPQGGRPGSTAPYPTGPPNMPGSNQGPDFRPASAFGINPNLRPSSAAAGGGLRPAGYGTPPAMGNQPRPYSNPPPGPQYGGPGYGRGGRAPSGNYPPPQGQGAPNIRPPQRPGTTSPYLGPGPRPGGPGTSPPTAPLDIGFSAPIEPERRRPQQNGPPIQPQRGSPKPQQAPVGQQGPPQNRPGQQGPRPGPGGGQNSFGGPNSRPPPPSRIQVPPNVKPANMAPSRPDANAPAGPAPPSKPASIPANAAPTRPPGKGPKTFDEMGVPAGKDKGDCVSTPSSL